MYKCSVCEKQMRKSKTGICSSNDTCRNAARGFGLVDYRCLVCDKRIRKSKTGICASSPQCRATYKAMHYQANKDRYQEQSKAWNEQNPDRNREFKAKWKSENPESSRECAQRRRARKAELFVDNVDLSVVWERDGGICHLCDSPVEGKWHLEHVISLNDEGTHEYDNVAVSHPYCNESKGSDSRSASELIWKSALAAYERFHGVEYR